MARDKIPAAKSTSGNGLARLLGEISTPSDTVAWQHRNRRRNLLDEFDRMHEGLTRLSHGFLIKTWLDVDGYIRISIDIPSETSRRRLEAAWSDISHWLSQANLFNRKHHLGEPPQNWPYSASRWMECLCRRRYHPGLSKDEIAKAKNRFREKSNLDKDDDDLSYADLADELNRDIMNDLEEAFFCQDAYREVDGSEDPQGAAALRSAREKMTFFNVSKKEQTEFLDRAYRDYSKGKPPVALKTEGPHRKLAIPRLKGPITREAVIAFFQHYRKK